MDLAKEGAAYVERCVKSQQRRLEVAQAEETLRKEALQQKQTSMDAMLQAASDALSSAEEDATRWKKAIEFVHRQPFVPDDSESEASTFLLESLLGTLQEGGQDDIASLMRSVDHPSTVSLSSVLGAEVVKLNSKVQKLRGKRDKLILKCKQAEKNYEKRETQRKRKALNLLDEDEQAKVTESVNRRRRQLWMARQSKVKRRRARRKPVEDFSDLPPCKAEKPVYSLQHKVEAVTFLREQLQQAREEGSRIGKKLRTKLVAMTKNKFGISKGVRLWRWVKEDEEQRWSAIPTNQRSSMKQLSDNWKKVHNIGSLRESEKRWVPFVVQEQLDHYLARSVLGVSRITPRQEEVLAEQLALTASEMCREYNKGLKQAGGVLPSTLESLELSIWPSVAPL